MEKYYAILYEGIYISKMKSYINHPYGKSVEISENDFLKMPIPCDPNFNPVNAPNIPVKSSLISEKAPEDETTLAYDYDDTDVLSMAIDHEYRLTLLELGITEA